MHSAEPTKTVLFVSTRKPEPTTQAAAQRCGASLLWAPSIADAANLFNLVAGRTVVVSELSFVDGNWRDLVERLRCSRVAAPVVLVAPATTAELWWDALDCGIEDILKAPLLQAQFCAFLQNVLRND